MEQVAEKLWDRNVRFEKLFWCAALQCAAPHEFEDFVEEDLLDCENLPAFLKNQEDIDAETVLAEMAMRRKTGFFFQAATPVPYNIRPDGSFSFSWGHYNTKWMYADALDEAAEMAAEWAEKLLEAAKAKAFSKGLATRGLIRPIRELKGPP